MWCGGDRSGGAAPFAEELRRLRQLAGGPSLNTLVAVAARRGRPLARSTLSDKLNAKSLPDWDFVTGYLGACVAYAEQAGARLPAELTDPGRWEAAHWRLLAAADAARADDRLAAALAERGRRVVAGSASPPTSAPAPFVPRQLPAAVRHFAGRSAPLAALTALLTELAGPPGTVSVSAIGGTAGVGKTALAVHWAHQVADRFPDGQLYVNLRGFDPSGVGAGARPRRCAASWTRSACRRSGSRPAWRRRPALYRSLLAGRRVLVLLDNARDADQVRPLLPGSPGCLVAGDQPQPAHRPGRRRGRPAARRWTCSPPAEARDLLARRLGARPGRRPSRTAVDADHRRLRAGCRWRWRSSPPGPPPSPGFPLAALAARAGRDAGGRARRASTAATPATDVRAVFSWSYRALSPAAGRLFRLLGLHPGPDIAVPAAASLAGLSPRRGAAAAGRAGPGAPAHRARPRPVRAPRPAPRVRRRAGRRPTTAEPTAGGRCAGCSTTTCTPRYAAALLLHPHRDPIDLRRRPARRHGGGRRPTTTQAMAWFAAEHRCCSPPSTGRPPARASTPTPGSWPGRSTTSSTGGATGTTRPRSSEPRWPPPDGWATGPGRPAPTAAWPSPARGWAAYDEAHAHSGTALDLYAELGDQVGQAHAPSSAWRPAERQGRHRRGARPRRAGARPVRGRRPPRRAGQRAQQQSAGTTPSSATTGRRWTTAGRPWRCCSETRRPRTARPHAWDSLGYAHHHLGRHRDAVDCYRQALGAVPGGRRPLLRGRHADPPRRQPPGRRRPAAARAAWRQALDILDRLGHPDAAPVRRPARRDVVRPAIVSPEIHPPTISRTPRKGSGRTVAGGRSDAVDGVREDSGKRQAYLWWWLFWWWRRPPPAAAAGRAARLPDRVRRERLADPVPLGGRCAQSRPVVPRRAAAGCRVGSPRRGNVPTLLDPLVRHRLGGGDRAAAAPRISRTMTRPRMPAAIRIQPTMSRSTPPTLAFTAKVEDRADGEQENARSDSHDSSLGAGVRCPHPVPRR